MNQLKPVKASKQPLLWTQAIRQTEYRGYSKRNILLSPIISQTFPFKKHLSYKLDHLIIGANPILTYLLILQLHKINLIVDNKNPIKIGVLFLDENDYWAYHALEKKEFWLELYTITKQKWGKNFQDLLKLNTHIFQDDKQQELIFIDNNFSIMNCLYDEYVDGYILHLKDKEPIQKNFHSETMPNVVESENIIRKKYQLELIEHFKDLNKKGMAINNLSYPLEKVSCKDNPTPTHLLLSQRVWLTSHPLGWLQTTPVDTQHPFNFDDESFTQILYSHLLSNYSFGSAQHTANDFYALEKMAIFDMMNTKINKTLLNKKDKYHDE